MPRKNNTIQIGKSFVEKTAQFYRQLGFQVHVNQHGRWGKKDTFGVADLHAVNRVNGRYVYVAVTKGKKQSNTVEKIRLARNEILPPGVEIHYCVWKNDLEFETYEY